MASFLYRIGRFAYRKWFVVAPIWLLLLAIAGASAAAFAQPPSTALSLPGIPSERAQDLLQERFDDQGNGDAATAPEFQVVIGTPDGSPLTTDENQHAVDAVLDDVRQIPDLAAPEAVGLGQIPPEALAGAAAAVPPGQPAPVTDWLGAVYLQSGGLIEQQTAQGLSPEEAQENASFLSSLSEDGSVYQVQVGFDTDAVETAMDVTDEQREAMEHVVAVGEEHGLSVGMAGPAAQEMVELELTSELIGLAVALLVLTVTFASIVAAFIPIVSAIVGVGIAVLTVTALGGVVEVNEFTPILATMLGLALAIDYSLFIGSRYRHEARVAKDRSHAAGMAVGTAGSAVVFAGLTVMIALSALSVVNIPFLTSMALAAAGAVVVAVLISLTFFPAVLGLLKSKVFAGRIPVAKAPDPEDEGVHTMGEQVAKGIQKRPVTTLVASVLALGVLSIPAASIQLALPTDATAESGTSQRTAVDLLSEGFGDGTPGPLIAVVDAADVPEAERGEAFHAAVENFSGLDAVANAQIVGTNGDPAAGDPGDAAQLLITPTSGPVDKQTLDLIHELRDGEEAFTAETGASYGITGQTAIEVDISDQLSSAMLPYLTIVVSLAFLLLMIVFRSIVVPLTAALGFLLTVGATFGATVAIFQWGWFGIAEGSPLVSFMPIILIGIVFGLAVDYQVFLVSRMRETYVHGHSAADSVVTGYKYGARVVTAAALIMISVFGAFMLQDQAFIMSMGFGLAAAVLFDAFVVRMLIMPAIMYLMGDKAWWLPGWLDRILPKVDIEGTALERGHGTSANDGADAAAEVEAEAAADAGVPAQR